MIPNRFHFVFGLKRQSAPFHLVHYLCLQSCLEVNRPDAIYFYYHYEPYGRYWDFIKEKLVLVKIPRVAFIDRYRYHDWHVARYKYAHAADFVRLEKLVSHGGVYADMDTLFVNPIPRALYNMPFVLGREDDIPDPITKQLRPSVCNAFMMSERNSRFGKLWLEQHRAAFNGTWSNHSTLLPSRLASQYPALVHLEPPRIFYKHMWTRQGIHTLLEGLDTDNEGVVSFHLWAHLWWNRYRRDFSTFHAGKMTEAFVRQVDTTYNVVARKFLPPRETRSFVLRQASTLKRETAKALEKVGGAARELGMRAYILTKLAAFSVIKENVMPRAAEHFDYAQRQWRHPYARTRFRSRNRFERQAVVDSIALWDEYGVEQMNFAPDDVILDVGAHIGTFSFMCYLRGSRRIYAFEPEVENFQRLAQHVGTLQGVHLFHLAVFRSDIAEPYTLVHSGYNGENTGGGNVLLRGIVSEFGEQLFDASAPEPQTVAVIGLDEILEQFARVRFLKLDCEASEYPILLTSRLLARVDYIAGEYHEVEAPLYAQLDPRAQLEQYSDYRAEYLVAHLQRLGFSVQMRRTANHLGVFTATRQKHST